MRNSFANASLLTENTVRHTACSGGAILFILIIMSALFVCSSVFIHFIHISQKEAIQHVFIAACDNGIESAAAHAEMLLHTDVYISESDSPKDIWVTVPRQKPIGSRREWELYISSKTNLHEQRWFSLPGPTKTTHTRYRIKIIDGYVSEDGFTHAQPFTPVARSRGKWVPTHDINALSRKEIAKLLDAFDPHATSAVWRTRVSAQLIDDRDANNILCDPDVPDTEALFIETVVHNEDTRWIQSDDLYRMGRYYEMRPNHNFFLIQSAHTNNDGTVTVTLDSEPLLPVVGWNRYKDIRSKMNAPRWVPHMFDNAPAATGSGDMYKEQRIVMNTKDTLTFKDNLLDRYAGNNGIRQTVTLKAWFSTLNTWMRAWQPSTKEKGAFATLVSEVCDSFTIKNLPKKSYYRLSCYTGRTTENAPPMQLGTGNLADLADTTIKKTGFETTFPPQKITTRTDDNSSLSEVFFRSPSGVSKNNPFYVYGFLLEQPEYLVLRNTSDHPLSLLGYRLGVQLGTSYIWSAPFSTASWYHADSAGRLSVDSPVIPARGICVITPDTTLFDVFMGATQDGVWGNTESENFPVIETGRDNPEARFAVVRARPGRSIEQYGSSSYRSHPWSTEWHLQIPALREYDTPHLLTNEVILFDPDGEAGEHPAVPGIVKEAKKGFLTVVLNGSRKAYAPTRKATLHFRGIPRGAESIFIVTPDGKPVAHIPAPPPDARVSQNSVRTYTSKNGVRDLPFTFDSLRSQLRNNNVHDFSAVNNHSYSSPAEKVRALKKYDVSIEHDWFVPSACFLACSNAARIITSVLSYVPDTFTLLRTEAHNFTLSQNEFHDFFNAGTPGYLYSTLYIDSHPMPLHIARVATEGIRTRSFSHTIPYHTPLVATCTPYNEGGGVHLSGAPGSVLIEWKDIPSANTHFSISIAGKTSRAWSIPMTASRWDAGTNSPIYLTCDIWNPFTRKYDTAQVKATFDESERIDLGTFPAQYLHNGTLRLRIHTHEQCRPGHAEVWLHGIYVYPVSQQKYVNINTAPVADVLAVCRTNRTLFTDIMYGKTGQYKGFHTYKSVADIFSTFEDSELDDKLPPEISTRSDIFTVFIESQVVKNNADTSVPLASRTRTFVLSREKSRINADAPVSRYNEGDGKLQ